MMSKSCFVLFIGRLCFVVSLFLAGCRNDKGWIASYHERESRCLALCEAEKYREAHECFQNLVQYVNDGIQSERKGFRLYMALAIIYARLYLVEREMGESTAENQWYAMGAKMFGLAQEKDGLHQEATYDDVITMIVEIDRKHGISWRKGLVSQAEKIENSHSPGADAIDQSR